MFVCPTPMALEKVPAQSSDLVAGEYAWLKDAVTWSVAMTNLDKGNKPSRSWPSRSSYDIFCEKRWYESCPMRRLQSAQGC